MKSLKDVYNRLVEHEKVAAAEAFPGDGAQTKLAMRQALEWDDIGRQMARRAFDEHIKEASAHMPVGHGDGHRHDDGRPCFPHCSERGRGAVRGRAAPHEKKAARQRQIFERIRRDPEYFSELVQRHLG